MNILWTTMAMVFVLGTLATVAWCLYELSPFARTPTCTATRTRKWLGRPRSSTDRGCGERS